MQALFRALVLSLLMLSYSLPAAIDQTLDSRGSDESGNMGHSVAPVVGYEPVYKFVFGAAYFYEERNTSFGVDANLNFKSVYQLHVNFRQSLSESWRIRFKSGITKGFDPYFGEGGQTSVDDFYRLWGIKWDNKLYAMHEFNPVYSLGFFTDVRVRTEEQGEEQPTFNRRFPDETTSGLGIRSIVDTRKTSRNQEEGFMFVTDLSYMPRWLSSLEDSTDFGQLEGSFIVYKEILDEVVPNVIAAFRLMGGVTFGTPSFLYKYRLGGANELPGYFDNRFRGSKYYLQQTELRVPVFNFLGIAAFMGFGDAADTSFTGPKVAYGAGLRIGLPPDFVSKLRIDVGVGQDQWGVFANFGQPF